MTRARQIHNTLQSSYADMLAQCQSGDEHACRYIIEHDEPIQCHGAPDKAPAWLLPSIIAPIAALVVAALLSGFWQ